MTSFNQKRQFCRNLDSVEYVASAISGTRIYIAYQSVKTNIVTIGYEVAILSRYFSYSFGSRFLKSDASLQGPFVVLDSLASPLSAIDVTTRNNTDILLLLQPQGILFAVLL